jgi:hypothetical protein
MLRFDRDYYIPKGATKIASKHSTAIVYIFELAGACYAMGFEGRRQKPSFHYRYQTPEKREQAIIAFFKACAEQAESKLQSRAKATAAHTLKKGDILYASWGYDQTNVDFYQVVDVVSDRTVRVRAICGNSTSTYCSGGTTVPIQDAFKERSEVLTRRVNGHYQAVRIDSVRTAHKWDGKPVRWSDGH